MSTTWTDIADNTVTTGVAAQAAASATASETSATASATSATAAAASAVSAAAEVVLAEAQVVLAEAQVVLATNQVAAATAAGAAQVVLAAAQVTLAEAQVVLAAAQVTLATAQATAAAASAASAAAHLAAFNAIYHGSSATAPTASVTTGDLWFDSSADAMKVYDGSSWVAAYVSVSGALLVANSLSDVASASSGRTNLGLGALAVLATVNNATWSGTDLAVVNGGTGASDTATAQTNLGLVIGTNVQAYDADLTALAGLSSADSNFVVGSAAGWVAESGATVRTSLGLGAMATQGSGAVAITGGSVVGITDLLVADGGTGQGSYLNGELLIGNTTGNTLAKATITAGTGISVTNGASAITIASTASAGISMGTAIAAAIIFG